MREGSLVSIKFDESDSDGRDGWNIPTDLYRKYICEYPGCKERGCSCQIRIPWWIHREFYINKFGLVVKSLTLQSDIIQLAVDNSIELEFYYSIVLFGDEKVLIPNSRLEECQA